MGYNKYCDPARVDIVENLRIRFTPANEFNDPFECLPDARLIEHPAWQRMIENASVREFLAEEAIKAQRERRPVMNIEAEIRRIHRERYSIRLPVMKRMAREHLRAARDPLRVLCLSQVAPDAEDALLLWGHYTSNHRGFALTFNENDAWFVGHKPVEGQPWDSGAVIYAERRPSWNVDEQGGVEPRPDFVFTKSLHWAYEKEFRLLRFKGMPGVETKPVDALVGFPSSALRAVTLGEFVSEDTKRRLKAALARPELAHVALYRAQIDPDHYRLNVNTEKL